MLIIEKKMQKLNFKMKFQYDPPWVYIYGFETATWHPWKPLKPLKPQNSPAFVSTSKSLHGEEREEIWQSLQGRFLKKEKCRGRFCIGEARIKANSGGAEIQHIRKIQVYMFLKKTKLR